MFQEVIRTKLLYGLESAQLTVRLQNRLDVMQLRGPRHILIMKTSYVDRSSTNQRVYERASEEFGHNKKVISFKEQYQKQKVDKEKNELID